MVRSFHQVHDDRTQTPKGFWPHPKKELFYKYLTPWKVPSRRKTKGRSRMYYDFDKESIQHTPCEELITSNRFQLLTEEDSIPIYNLPQEEKNEPDEPEHSLYASNSLIPESDDDLFSDINSFDNFMLKDDKHLNNSNYYLYNRNKDFSSGYFPDFITLHDPIYYQLSNSTRHNFYYLKINNGKYLKYLSNRTSKYNNIYFDNLKDAYRISKKYSGKLLNSNESKHVKDNSSSQIKLQYQQNPNRGIPMVNHNNQSHISSPLGNNQCGNLNSQYNDHNPQNYYASGYSEMYSQQSSERRTLEANHFNNTIENHTKIPLYPLCSNKGHSPYTQSYYPHDNPVLKVKDIVSQQDSEKRILKAENTNLQCNHPYLFPKGNTFSQQDSGKGILKADQNTLQNSIINMGRYFSNYNKSNLNQSKTSNLRGSWIGTPKVNDNKYYLNNPDHPYMFSQQDSEDRILEAEQTNSQDNHNYPYSSPNRMTTSQQGSRQGTLKADHNPYTLPKGMAISQQDSTKLLNPLTDSGKNSNNCNRLNFRYRKTLDLKDSRIGIPKVSHSGNHWHNPNHPGLKPDYKKTSSRILGQQQHCPEINKSPSGKNKNQQETQSLAIPKIKAKNIFDPQYSEVRTTEGDQKDFLYSFQPEVNPRNNCWYNPYHSHKKTVDQGNSDKGIPMVNQCNITHTPDNPEKRASRTYTAYRILIEELL